MDIKELTEMLVKSGESNRGKFVPWCGEDPNGMYRYDMFSSTEIADVDKCAAEFDVDLFTVPVGTSKHTLFHLLVWHNFYNAVKTLIGRKIDVDVADGGGKGVTSLMLACIRTNLEMVKLLIDGGADRLRADASGKTCYHYLAGTRPPLSFSFHCRDESRNQLLPIARLLGDNFDVADADGKTPLIYIITGKDNSVSSMLIDFLLSKGVKTDYMDDEGNTLLMLAIKYNHNTAALRLAGNKQLVNAANAKGETPLKIADAYGKDAVCMELKSNGAEGDSKFLKIDMPDFRRITSNAFAFGDEIDFLAIGLYLAQKLINTVDEDDDDEIGYIADILPDALGKDPTCSVLDMVVKAGISLTDKISSRGRVMCLRDKCFCLRAGVGAIEKLASLGVDINSAIIDGKTPVHILAENPVPMSIGGKKITYFEDAARLFDAQSATVLDNSGISAMHTAVRYGHDDLLKVFAENGADINVTQDAPSKAGNTPLHVACETANAKAAKVLIELGADDGIKNVDGETAAHIVVAKNYIGGYSEREKLENDRIEILGMLKAIDEPRNDGMTPLMLLQYESGWFAERAQPVILAAGADVNRKDARGRTALIIAADQHSNKNVIKELFRAGADICAADVYGKTALHYSLRTGDQDVARYLIKKGADYNRADNEGVTPAMIAAEKGYDNVLELMTDIK